MEVKEELKKTNTEQDSNQDLMNRLSNLKALECGLRKLKKRKTAEPHRITNDMIVHLGPAGRR